MRPVLPVGRCAERLRRHHHGRHGPRRPRAAHRLRGRRHAERLPDFERRVRLLPRSVPLAGEAMTDTTTHIAALDKRCRELEEAVRVLADELVVRRWYHFPRMAVTYDVTEANPIARTAVEKASGKD